MNRRIRKVAVLGSGIMGSRIACHFANIGVKVLLLDIVPGQFTEEDQKKGLKQDSLQFKNKVVNDALISSIKSKPAPLFSKERRSFITTGNFDDHMAQIAECDWVIEVVIENLDIKKKVFEKVEQFRKPGTLITSNTSGIPINSMTEGRSEDFVKHFCGTHFFNPPRYLKLLEIIPSKGTSQEVIDFLKHYGDLYLGKTVVMCKDTPAFIANRVGVFSIMNLFHTVEKMGLSVEAVDKLTGPVLGRPKSATFRTCDVVGLDTLAKVAMGVKQFCPKDEANEQFQLPKFIQKMLEANRLGSKTKAGFYKKEGKEILALDLNTQEYKAKERYKSPTLEMAKSEDNLKKRMKILFGGQDAAGEFYRVTLTDLFAYVSHRIPEISDDIVSVDKAMKAGFGWELGPFELWDAIGLENAIKVVKARGVQLAAWVEEMLASGVNSFYQTEDGVKHFYSIASKSYQVLEEAKDVIYLDSVDKSKVLYSNSGCSVKDLGDGVLNIEFHSKMNTMGGEVLAGINAGIDIAEKEGWNGVVIGNQGANFSVGANLGILFMYAVEQEWDEVDFAIRAFQKTMMRVRYSDIPVVVAPHAMALGGGCEIALHADKVVASAETYTGLVEVGAGVIPGGGGTKEFALRLSDETFEGDIELPGLRNSFLTIGMAKVSTSAEEAFGLGYYRKGKDKFVMNQSRLIGEAKAEVLKMHAEGYTRPVERKDIRVLGRQGLGMVYAGANTMYSGKYISEHDKLISEKLGYVLCGGDLSAKTQVSEQYLLNLEREAFLSLCGERKTLERIQSLLTTGKPLRN